ncbi:MAG: YeeE/YedE family protein [Hoeflea sp.]|uniref:YeeE/YedE thiosulfate transporter family protein n=1 Tax=Hoeflea sp. TaxID=1940281 RepID=UPI001D7E8E3B|nr:YeeE/YedE thiosulfate transporter family protein [Hoeflea sp.]MBU4527081.1 YeeE/YedE family protein [Alphaproteobacteria bacterium]MBU4547040.1 YeeE/YedE family protein [Alphaproteobacteria bacterium]MBU4553334.1 YeeE/YedE family protein [Alphaproteobacteria bacterium]MBV1721818.1 YeeE/YedE family protein [Hoeflea sp.]MBV1783203.1 YeeE/YedE family protein [Hoeflea sp.]
MVDPGKAVKKTSAAERAFISPLTGIVAGIVFGFVFGFLLQKGGVGTYHILMGQLLFQDWTVVKIMLTAIIVGMIGIFPLHHFAKVNLHIKPTKLASNIAGGLLFGVGFALVGYCPGTAAAAVGQGSWDALFGMAGLVAGSWLYAEMSGTLKQTIDKVGDLGRLTFLNVLPLPKWAVIISATALLTGFLLVLEIFTVH